LPASSQISNDQNRSPDQSGVECAIQTVFQQDAVLLVAAPIPVDQEKDGNSEFNFIRAIRWIIRPNKICSVNKKFLQPMISNCHDMTRAPDISETRSSTVQGGRKVVRTYPDFYLSIKSPNCKDVISESIRRHVQ
jgi:hypothetical protein